MFKMKKINVYFDDEWILCDFNKNKSNQQSQNNVCYSADKEEQNIIKNKFGVIKTNKINEKYNICKNTNLDISEIKTMVDDDKINILPLNRVNNYNWFSLLYESIMDMIAEVDILKVFLLFDEKRMPSISI
tara:strand:+ start:1159 stop:1551 length:393 start_codon:yes stop_codon:yes gene_type:complete